MTDDATLFWTTAVINMMLGIGLGAAGLSALDRPLTVLALLAIAPVCAAIVPSVIRRATHDR